MYNRDIKQVNRQNRLIEFFEMVLIVQYRLLREFQTRTFNRTGCLIETLEFESYRRGNCFSFFPGWDLFSIQNTLLPLSQGTRTIIAGWPALFAHVTGNEIIVHFLLVFLTTAGINIVKVTDFVYNIKWPGSTKSGSLPEIYLYKISNSFSKRIYFS